MRVDHLQAEDVISPDRYAAEGYPFEAWALLRREAPVRWFDFGERPSFWAVTRRADIVWLSRQPERFLNAPRQAIFADSPGGADRPAVPLTRHLLSMDPSEHGTMRLLASAWFTPRAIARRRPEVERLAAELIDGLAERAKLRADPAFVNSAVEETVRFTSPVIQFCRTPVADFELQGQTIRAGESLCLFYPSANRDESVFDEPDQFRIARHPNPHIGFGIGEHFCLGANLARLELRVIFEQLIPRLRDVGLAAPPERMRSSFLGGVKRMPLEYQLESPAARRS